MFVIVRHTGRLVDASVGTAVEAAKAEVGAVRVALTGGPTVGDGSRALGVGQGVDVGAGSATSADGVAVHLTAERFLSQAVEGLGGGAVHVVPWRDNGISQKSFPRGRLENHLPPIAVEDLLLEEGAIGAEEGGGIHLAGDGVEEADVVSLAAHVDVRIVACGGKKRRKCRGWKGER